VGAAATVLYGIHPITLLLLWLLLLLLLLLWLFSQFLCGAL
jgi:hypothetical protein